MDKNKDKIKITSLPNWAMDKSKDKIKITSLPTWENI
jgi:hypothetical protein